MYKTLKELSEKAAEVGFAEAVLLEDAKERAVSAEEILRETQKTYQAMRDADTEYDPVLLSHSGLAGQDGAKMEQYLNTSQTIGGPFVCKAVMKAIKMGESNACMKRIVAAPTAGACGVLPALLLSMQEENAYSDEEMAKALLTAAGIGGVIASTAFIAGAAGGCQAEIGSASAMAAGAAVYLKGGTPEQICHAVAMALKNLLGLVCDPVCGLVEVPCVKRNCVGVVNAIAAADMALAGIQSKIPADEVIEAMRSVGMQMPVCLKETSKGGLAVTETAKMYQEQVFGTDSRS